MIRLTRIEVIPGVFANLDLDEKAVLSSLYDRVPRIIANVARVSARERIRKGDYANDNKEAAKVMFSIPHSWEKDEHYIVIDHKKYKKIKYGTRIGMRALFKSQTLYNSIFAETHHKHVSVHCIDYGIKHFKGGTFSVPEKEIKRVEKIFGIKVLKGKVRVAKREFSTWASLEEKRFKRMLAREARKVERDLNN